VMMVEATIEICLAQGYAASGCFLQVLSLI